MAKMPGFIVVTGQHIENGQMWVHFRVRTWHPRFLLLLWQGMKQQCQQNGVSPYHPKVLLTFAGFVLGRLLR